MIFIREVHEITRPGNRGSERTIEIREFKEVIDVWEWSRVMSFSGHMTLVDKGGCEESCEYIQGLLDSKEPFILAVGLMDHETEGITSDLEEGEHGVIVITFQAISAEEYESHVTEPPDIEYDPASEGVGDPYNYDESTPVYDLPDDPNLG